MGFEHMLRTKNLLERKAGRTSQSIAQIKNAWTLTFTPH